jgi:hypothetical protein
VRGVRVTTGESATTNRHEAAASSQGHALIVDKISVQAMRFTTRPLNSGGTQRLRPAGYSVSVTARAFRL